MFEKMVVRREFLERLASFALGILGTVIGGCGADSSGTGPSVYDSGLLPKQSPTPTPNYPPVSSPPPELPTPTPPANPNPTPTPAPPPSPTPGPNPTGQTILYDTYAKVSLAGALPNSLVISAEKVKIGSPWEIEFDFGHPGSEHTATIGASEIEKMKRLEKVQISSSTALFHRHTVTIDFSDVGQRVPGATPVAVPK